MTHKKRVQKSLNISRNITNSMHSKEEIDASIEKITSMNSKETMETIDFELIERMSMWTRPKRKLRFLTHLLRR